MATRQSLTAVEPCADAPPLEPERAALSVPELRLTLLGAPRVALGTRVRVRSLKRHKAMALLAYLALTAHLFSSEALASLLAAVDAHDAQAKIHLRNTSHAVRPQFMAYLRLTPETIALHPERTVWVDALEVQRAVLAASASGADTTALAQAVTLYMGPLLAGFTIHEAPQFEDAEQRRLRVPQMPVHRRLAAWEEQQACHHDEAAAPGNACGPLSDMLTVAACGGCAVDHERTVVT